MFWVFIDISLIIFQEELVYLGELHGVACSTSNEFHMESVWPQIDWGKAIFWLKVLKLPSFDFNTFDLDIWYRYKSPTLPDWSIIHLFIISISSHESKMHTILVFILLVAACSSIILPQVDLPVVDLGYELHQAISFNVTSSPSPNLFSNLTEIMYTEHLWIQSAIKRMNLSCNTYSTIRRRVTCS